MRLTRLRFLLALAVPALLVVSAARAQPGYYVVPLHHAGHNPGELNTDPEDFAPPAGWHELLVADSGVFWAPRWSPIDSLPVGFAFRLGGQVARRFKVASTGVLTFDVGATAVPPLANQPLPSPLVPPRSICAWGLAMDTAAYNGGFVNPRNDVTSRIVTRTFGTAPHRQFWVQLRCFSSPAFTSLAGGGRFRHSKTNWSFVLEETTNAVYVVDQRTRRYVSTDSLALTVGIQLSATQAVMAPGSPVIDSDCYGYGVNGSTSLAVASPGDNTYYAFFPGTQPAADLAFEAAELPRYLAPGASSLTLRGRVRNLGSQAATAYVIAYRVNGGPVLTPSVGTGHALATAAADSIAASVVAPSGPGTYRYKFWVWRQGSAIDEVPANDTLTRVVQVADRVVARLPLLEMFTSSSCPPCAPANDSLRALIRRRTGPLTVVKYQQNYPGDGDPYATAETVGRFLHYYGSYIPFVTLNGRDPGVAGTQITEPLLQAAAGEPALLDLDATYQVQGRTVTTAARVRPYLAAGAGQLVLHTVVLERSTYLNVGINGETSFDNVVKKLLPDAAGAPLGALTASQPIDISQTYTFPAANTVESFDSLLVVTFVQDAATREVLQSAVARLNGVLGVPAAPPTATTKLTLTPNPAPNGLATAHLTLATAASVELTVVDALGRVVLRRPARPLAAGAHTLPLELRDAVPGLYLVRLTVGDQVTTRRLVVE